MTRRQRRRTPLLAGAFAALCAVPASAVAAVDFLSVRPGVPDAVLAGIRGGISTAGAFWSFAIVRTVTVNDAAVLRQELRISDLAPLIRSGVLPEFSTENLGAGVAVGSGNSLTDAVAGQTVTSSAANAAAKQAALQLASPAATTAPATQAAPAADASAATPAPGAQPLGTPAAKSAAVALTTPLVVNVPNGNGTIQAIVINLPNAGAIVQNTLDSVHLGVRTSLDVSARVLDAARSGLLRQQIIDSLNLPH